MKEKSLESLTKKQIENKDKDKMIAVQLIASVEQHGPHLPVGTDYYLGEEILDRVRKELDADKEFWFLPTLPYGSSAEHAGYAGVISMKPSTLLSIYEDLADSLLASGIKNIVLATSHGGNVDILKIIIRNMRLKGLNAFFLDLYSFYAPASENDPVPMDVHGGVLETSMILAIEEGLVHKNEIVPEMARSLEKMEQSVGESGPATQAWITTDTDYDGVIGDPRLASAEYGEKWLSRVAGSVVETLNKIHAIAVSK